MCVGEQKLLTGHSCTVQTPDVSVGRLLRENPRRLLKPRWRQIASPHGLFIWNLKLCSFAFDCMSGSNNMRVQQSFIFQSFVMKFFFYIKPLFSASSVWKLLFFFCLCSKLNITEVWILDSTHSLKSCKNTVYTKHIKWSIKIIIKY